ncbi:MAG: cysteine desulfurase family protein [Chloroflexota bacterium]|nr:MAG: cysteine desulfurase NifS [Chloroflexota bacterium]
MSARRLVYLDHSATTPVDPRVVEAMLPYFTDVFGNASSAHGVGRRAEQAIEDARERVARLLNCSPAEIIFTSGGSESDNLALRGVAWYARATTGHRHLITTPVEHDAVGKTVEQLESLMAFERTVLPVDRHGLVDAGALAAAIRPDTALVSVIYASNEVGTIQPIPALAAVARERGVLFHSDAVQAAGQLSLDVQALGVDLLSLSAHKFYGPKGVGLLYVRDGVELSPVQTGGSHEGARRAGTQNTPLIVGLATALELAESERDARVARYSHLRDMLIDGILSRLPNAELTGHPAQRLPSHASFIFDGVDGNTLLMHLDLKGVAASSGSACKTGNPEPSSVLLAMGYTPDRAKNSLRLTVGAQTTEEDVAYAIDAVVDAVGKVSRLQMSQPGF